MYVLAHDGPRLVRVGELEFKHRLEDFCVGRIAHYAFALKSPGGLRRGELLRRAARRRRIAPPLERVRYADNLPRFLVHVVEVFAVLAHVAFERVHADERGLLGIFGVDYLHVVLVVTQRRVRRQRDKRAAPDEFVDYLFAQAVRGVLLVGYLVDVAVAEKLPVDAHVFLEYHGVDVGFVVRYPRRHKLHAHDGQAELVHLTRQRRDGLRAGDKPAVAQGYRLPYLLKLLRALHPLCRAAVGADLPAHRAGVLGHVRPELAFEPAHGRSLALRPVRRQHRRVRRLDELVGLGLRLLLALVLLERVLAGSVVHGLKRAAGRAAPEPPRLIVLEVLELHVADPGVEAYPARVVAVIGYVLRHQAGGGVGLAAALNLRLLLALVGHVHAIAPVDVLLGLRHFEDDVIHVLDARIHAVLRHELFGVDGAHGQLANGVVGALSVVPFHEVRAAALDGHRPLHEVVYLLKRQAVELVSQHVLDDFCKAFVLGPYGGDLGRGDGAVDLALDELGADVAHVRRLRVVGPRRGHDGVYPPRALIKRLALVHPVRVVFGRVLREPRLPKRQTLFVHALTS